MWWKRLLTGCGCASLALLLGVAFVAYDLSRPIPNAGPPIGPSGKPLTPKEDREGAEAVEARLRKTAESPKRRVHVSLTEQEANQVIRAHPRTRRELDKAEVQQLVVNLQSEEIEIAARVRGPNGAWVRVSAKGKLRTENGKLAGDLTGARLGSIPAPKPLLQQLNQRFQDALKDYNKKLRGRIESLEVGGGSLAFDVLRDP